MHVPLFLLFVICIIIIIIIVIVVIIIIVIVIIISDCKDDRHLGESGAGMGRGGAMWDLESYLLSFMAYRLLFLVLVSCLSLYLSF